MGLQGDIVKNANLTWHQNKVTKKMRSKIKKQKPCIVWLTGLSGSGKSTIANELEYQLNCLNKHTYLLDGDNIRLGINSDLGFSDKDRSENIRRISEIAKLFVDSGLIVITAFISPFQKDRNFARSLVEQNEFIEVYLDTPLSVCQQRDPKKLYQKAKLNQIENFTGISSIYETPNNAEIVLNTENTSVKECVKIILDYINAE